MRVLAAACSCLLGAVLAAAEAQTCEPGWLAVFQGGDVSGPVRALAALDIDGDGPLGAALYAVHSPKYTSPPRPVVRWNDGAWEAVGGDELVIVGGGAPNGSRCALAVFDPPGGGSMGPSLYVGGSLVVDRDGNTTRAVARFDGAAWTHVGTRFVSASDVAHDLEVFDADGAAPGPARLFAAGEFLASDGSALIGVAAWDGATWSDLGTPLGSGKVCDLLTWDPDASGPSPAVLLAAGLFDASPAGPSYLAAWNGAAWSGVGAGAPGRPGPGISLAVFDEDDAGPMTPALFVYGAPNTIDPGATFGGGLARWNGTAWTTIVDFAGNAGAFAVAPPQNGRMVVHDDDGAGPMRPALYAAISDPADPRFIVRYDGVSATRLGAGPQRSISGTGGTSREIDSLVSFDFDGGGPNPARLVVGGGFTSVAETPASPYALDEVSGNFVALWDGIGWSALGRGVAAPIPALPTVAVLKPFDADEGGSQPEALYVGGTFNTAGEGSIPLRTGATVGGAGDTSALLHANARWTAVAGWQDAGLDPEAGPRSSPRRIMAAVDFDADGVDPGGAVKYVAGSFVDLEGAASGPMARWNALLNTGTGGWENFGAASGGSMVHALAVYDADGDGPAPARLYVAGDFDVLSNETTSASGAVGAWDGSAWSGMGFAHGSAVVTDLAVFDPDAAGPGVARLIAAGDFVQQTAQGLAKDVAQFDGAAWTPLGEGSFTGQVDLGVPVSVSALAVFDDDGPGPTPPALYAAGNFFQWTDGATPIPTRGIARWDGSSWAALSVNLGAPTGCGVAFASALPKDLVVFDPDGPGGFAESLFAGGFFTAPEGASQGIARWDGEAWHALGGGLSFGSYNVCGIAPGALDLEVFDDDGDGPNAAALFVAGRFLRAGADSAWAIAKWGCADSAPLPPCPGDANADGAVNFADITSVLTNWLAAYPNNASPGDANHDAVVNFADITAVLTNFGGACG